MPWLVVQPLDKFVIGSMVALPLDFFFSTRIKIDMEWEEPIHMYSYPYTHLFFQYPLRIHFHHPSWF